MFRSMLVILAIGLTDGLWASTAKAGGGLGGYVSDRMQGLGSGLAQFDRGRTAVMTNPATYQALGAGTGAVMGGPEGAMIGYQMGGVFGNGVAGQPSGAGGMPMPMSMPTASQGSQGYNPAAYQAMQQYSNQQSQQRMAQMRLAAQLQADQQRQQYQYQQNLYQMQRQQNQWQMQQQQQAAQRQQQAALTQGIFNTIGGVLQSGQGQP